MTAKKGTLAKSLVDEFDFSGDTAGIGVTIGMSEEECTTLQATAALYTAILPSTKLEFNGYVRAAGSAGDFEQELAARLGVAGSYVANIFGTDEAAPIAYVLETFGANMQIAAPAKGLMTLNGAWGMGAGGSRGKVIFEGELDATGAEAAIDLGAAGSAGGECYLFVQSMVDGPATDATVLVESSATEGGTYATEATFEFDTVGAYKVAMTGTVNRWVRLNVDSLGGATSFVVVLIVCVDGVTQ